MVRILLSLAFRGDYVLSGKFHDQVLTSTIRAHLLVIEAKRKSCETNWSYNINIDLHSNKTSFAEL